MFLGRDDSQQQKSEHFAYPRMRQRDEETKVLQAHEALIRDVARPFERFGIPREDLLQEGRLGLLRAHRKWDPNVGASVWTYARRFVLGAILEAIGNALAHTSGRDDEVETDSLPGQHMPLEERQMLDRLSEVLTADEREILRMYFVDDMTLREIAAKKRCDAARKIEGAIEKMRRAA